MKKLFVLLAVLLFAMPNISAKCYGFGYKRCKNFIRPTPGREIENLLKQYNSYYIGKDEKVLYLTFDCGYENGFTPKILDTLKTHNVKACFFVTGHFIKENKALLEKMSEDGHIIANHTNNHKNMSKISSEEMLKDLEENQEIYHNLTNKDLSKFIRPPEGQFSEESLRVTNEAGYINVFWSISHVDWFIDKQNGYEASLKTVMDQIHNGGIFLFHNISEDNSLILDTIITNCKSTGYQFESLEYLIENN